MQLLLHMHRTNPAGAKNPSFKYHGRIVEVPLPAGMATLSGWFDVTKSMPSVDNNQIWDYLTPLYYDNPTSQLPMDEIWPTTSPRGDVLCNLSLLCHPLVSPMWKAALPGSLSKQGMNHPSR
jgi:hypothetical protein